MKCYVYHPNGPSYDDNTPAEPTEDVTCEWEGLKWCVKIDASVDYFGDYADNYDDFDGVSLKSLLDKQKFL